MKRTILAAAVLAALSAPAVTMAQSAPAFTGNATVVSDYRFRGISQTFKLPAMQGGFDYAHSSGFYVGNWNSSVSGLVYPNGASLEMDFYGGYKKTIGDFGFDVGYLYYYYPGTEVSTTSGWKKLDNQEFYVGGTWKFLTAKVSYALAPYFGLNGALATSGYWCDRTPSGSSCALPDRGSSRGTLYYDLTAAYEIFPKLTLTGHVGHTAVKNYGELSYTDYKLGVTYDLNGWLLGAAFVTTDADKGWYYTTNGAGKTKEIGKSTVVFSLGKTF